MKKESITLFVLLVKLLFITAVAHSEKRALLSDLTEPTSIKIDDEQIYITEATKVFIYNKENLELLKIFGRKGDRRQEFRIDPKDVSQISVRFINDHIYVSNQQRVSQFTNRGKFIDKDETSVMTKVKKSKGD